MRLLVLAVVLAGCGPAVAVITDPNSLDTGFDHQGGDDTASLEDPEDTGTPEDTGEEAPWVYAWSGERTFTFAPVAGRQCIETVQETGSDVTEDEEWASALAACPSCDLLFRVEADPEKICADVFTEWGAVSVGTPSLRGVSFKDDGDATLWSFRQRQNGEWRVESLADAQKGATPYRYTYTYDGRVNQWMNYTVEGTVSLAGE